jgi:hypothetical protein
MLLKDEDNPLILKNNTYTNIQQTFQHKISNWQELIILQLKKEKQIER